MCTVQVDTSSLLVCTKNLAKKPAEIQTISNGQLALWLEHLTFDMKDMSLNSELTES